jgi:hypothetical protein
LSNQFGEDSWDIPVGNLLPGPELNLPVTGTYKTVDMHALSNVNRLFATERGSRGRDTNSSLTEETGLGPHDP